MKRKSKKVESKKVVRPVFDDRDLPKVPNVTVEEILKSCLKLGIPVEIEREKRKKKSTTVKK